MQSSTQLKGGHVFLHSHVAFSSGWGMNLMPKGEVVLISLCCCWRPGVGSSVEGATKLDLLGPGLQVCYLHCAHSFSAASCSGVGSGVAALALTCLVVSRALQKGVRSLVMFLP